MTTTIEIHTTKKGQKVEFQFSPKGTHKGRILVDGKANGTAFYDDETLEDYIFMVTSSSPVWDKEDAEAIAKKVQEVFQNRQA
jgi:hypothetical protein